jgi:ABC-type multidrug transport system permease subunit
VSTLRLELAGAAAILRRDFVIFTSYRLRFLSEIIAATLGVAVFYYVSRLVTGGGFSDPDEYFGFAVIGLAVLEVLTAGLIVMPMALRQELVAGTFERALVSAFGPIQCLIAMSIFPFLSAVVGAVITIGVSALVFGMPMHWSTVPAAFPAAALGFVAFLPFAVLVTAAAFVVKQVGAGAGLVVTCLSIVAGVLFPVALLPDWIEWTSQVQPLTPALDLLRHLVVGTPLDSAWRTAARLAAFALVLLPASIVVLRAALRYAQKHGTVLEY